MSSAGPSTASKAWGVMVENPVIATGPHSAHQGLLFRQLSDRVTMIVHDPAALGADDRHRLAARGVPIVDRSVASVVTEGDTVRGVCLDDGRVIDADAVVVGPRAHPGTRRSTPSSTPSPRAAP